MCQIVPMQKHIHKNFTVMILSKIAQDIYKLIANTTYV